MSTTFSKKAFALAMMLGLPLGGCAGGDVGAGEPSDESAFSAQPKTGYLALGDSVAFGYNPVDAVSSPFDITKFIGYAEVIQATTNPKTLNASCQGETSGSFIDASKPDNGCHKWRADKKAMHVKYELGDRQSQLAYAVTKILFGDVAKISIGIGANDLLLLQNSCGAQFPTDLAGFMNCLQTGAPATIQKAATNFALILTAIKAAGFKGQIVLVTYYAPNYANPNDINLLSIAGLDKALVQVAQQFDIDVAQGFSAFAQNSAPAGYDACTAGLLYRMADGTCDKHPSMLGQQVLSYVVDHAVKARSIDLTAAVPAM